MAGVDAGYAHYPKQAVPVELLEVGGASIKLYHLEKPGEPVTEDVEMMARTKLAMLSDEPASGWQDDDCGFAIVHRCGADFHFLLPALWHGNNELWEAVLYHQGGMMGFDRFDPAYPPVGPDGVAVVRPTFCVWELGIVAHEARAWSAFLASERTKADFFRWCDDSFSGAV